VVRRAFAVRKGSTPSGPQDLAGKVVIVTRGSTADQDIQQQIRQHHVKDVTVRYTNNEGAAVKMVSQGKVFACGGGLGSEPFPYPVRTADAGLVKAFNAFIAASRASYGK